MRKVSVRTLSEQFEIDLPERAEELQLRQAIDLEKALFAPVDNTDVISVQKWLVNAGNVIFPGIAERLPIGNDSATGINGLLSIVQQVIHDYKPEEVEKDYSFSVGENKFTIIPFAREVIGNYKLMTELPVWAFADAMQARMVYENSLDKDIDGSLRFTYLLTIIACCTKMNGQGWPDSESEAMAEFSHRLEVLQDVSLNVAIDLEHFFFHGMKNAEKNTGSYTFSSHPDGRQQTVTNEKQ